MTCPNCIALRTRVAELERQIGTGFGKGHLGAMGDAFGLTPREAQMLLTLYYRNDWTSTLALERHLDCASNTTQVHIYRLRRKLGHDAIESWWSMGYRLPPATRAKIKEVLQ